MGIEFPQKKNSSGRLFVGRPLLICGSMEKPDLAILDVMLPDGDGFSLMEQLRAWTDIPVIFLTARDEAADRLAGLGLGADDYIAKPFLPQEFLLRVYAVLRRCYKEGTAVLKLESSTVDFSRAEVDKGGEILPLTAMEYKLLASAYRRGRSRSCAAIKSGRCSWIQAGPVFGESANSVNQASPNIEQAEPGPRHGCHLPGDIFL